MIRSHTYAASNQWKIDKVLISNLSVIGDLGTMIYFVLETKKGDPLMVMSAASKRRPIAGNYDGVWRLSSNGLSMDEGWRLEPLPQHQKT